MAADDGNGWSESTPTAHSTHSARSVSDERPTKSRTKTSTRRPSEHGTSYGRGTELVRQPSRRSSTSKRRQPKWWKIRLFRGMINDVKRRAPYYWSDWRDAWDYRVVPATVYMYFANILPALAFSFDMFTKTNQSFGVNEVLLASVLGAVIFACLAAQPLVIVGVTGPITVFNITVFDILLPTGIDYFGFMGWIGIWAMLMHWVLAFTNSSNALTYVTRFSCDIFGFYVAFIYLQKGIQVLTIQWVEADGESAFLAVTLALLVLGFAYGCGILGESTLFRRSIRLFFEDYGTPGTIVFFTGFVYYGRMKDVDVQTLPVSRAFFPTTDRSWLVPFWDLPVGDIFLALPFALLLTILFWFDHNGKALTLSYETSFISLLIFDLVSSLIAQGSEFPLRKPPGFHWDIFLLGFTVGICGILGLPFPNGLIPQAPFHTTSLCVTVDATDPEDLKQGKTNRVVDHVVEQRVSNLAQGLMTLATMSGPLLVVLNLIPQGVLAGLFLVMGVQALQANGMTQKMLYLARDKELTPSSDPLASLDRQSAIWVFVAIELVGFGATFAITQTVAALGFPVFILLLIPIRTFLMPKWFRSEELKVLDPPTAGPFVMESVGGAYGDDDLSSDSDNDANKEATGSAGAEKTNSPSEAQNDPETAVEDSMERGEGETREIDRIQGEHGGGKSSQGKWGPVGMRRRSSAVQKRSL